MTTETKDAREARRAGYRAAGLCPYDGRPVHPARRRCRRCLDVALASEGRKTAARLAAGMCSECGKRPPDPGITMCRPCRKLCAKRTKATRTVYIDSGICRDCGRKPACEGGTSCQGCRRLRAQRDLVRAAAWRAAGLCAQCGRPPEPGYVICRRCCDTRKAIYHRRPPGPPPRARP